MMELAGQLFPIHRTLVNQGYADSLEIIRQQLPLDIEEYPSGMEVYDWIIPDSWDVNEAYIEDMQGNRLVDFADNNLHLSAYSIPFQGVIPKEELLQHIRSLEDQPEAIPYNFLYYRQDWEFNIAHRELNKFTDSQYRVHIDVDAKPGTLKIGQCYLPGESKKELLFSTYLCHPSLANDNLAGVVVAVELFKQLAKIKNRRHSYRLIIIPETIGAITYLANHEDRIKDTLGAYVVYDCGDSGNITYKKSYFENAQVDRVAEHVLKHFSKNASIRGWHPSGSDERQYNAPGVRIPAGSFMRTPAGEFQEYHTSKDTLDIFSEAGLLDSVQTLYRFVQLWEQDLTYTNNYKGEPCFSRHQIPYPSFHRDRGNEAKQIVKKMIFEFDGSLSLLEIADKWNIPFDQVEFVANQFYKAGLVKPA